MQDVIVCWILTFFPLFINYTFLFGLVLWMPIHTEIINRSEVARLWCVFCISYTISYTRLELKQLLRRFEFNFIFHFRFQRTFRRNVFQRVWVYTFVKGRLFVLNCVKRIRDWIQSLCSFQSLDKLHHLLVNQFLLCILWLFYLVWHQQIDVAVLWYTLQI